MPANLSPIFFIMQNLSVRRAGPFFTSVRLPVLLHRKAWLLTALMLNMGAALAQNRFEDDFDDPDKPWQEITVQLPAAPKKEDLLQFTVGPTTSHIFSIDVKSLTVGSDGVIRYTLHAKSAGGAESISYEGIRCQSYEKKLYAFGQRDGSWSRSRRDKWENITATVANRPHAALAKDYFCTHQVISGSASDIIERMRSNRRLQDDRLHNPA